jgi:outer membrane protein TolC
MCYNERRFLSPRLMIPPGQKAEKQISAWIGVVLLLAVSLIAPSPAGAAEQADTNNIPGWLASPISLQDAIEIALKQNANILRSKAEIEANQGIVLQTRAIIYPTLRSSGNFTAEDQALIEKFPSASGFVVPLPDKSWNLNLQLVQSVYEGGRMKSALRSAKLSRDQALLQYQSVVADALLDVSVAYDDVLLATELINVQEASVKLLTKELTDTQSRFEAGTVPRFNVLRAEVELANARPRLIHARNVLRVAKNTFATSIGYNIPTNIWQEIPLQLSGKLEALPIDYSLPVAMGKAMEMRPEIAALHKAEGLRREGIVNAKSGYKPSVQIFGGYGARNSSFNPDISDELHGWTTGIQFSWNWFDGYLTKGRIEEARALHQRSVVDLDDTTRRIQQEVRTAFSNFIEAQEVLESQKKVQEQAEEALRLAIARNEAGAGTQLDVLSAQTALTEARSTQVQALHDYAVARARLQRAVGAMHPQPK